MWNFLNVILLNILIIKMIEIILDFSNVPSLIDTSDKLYQ